MRGRVGALRKTVPEMTRSEIVRHAGIDRVIGRWPREWRALVGTADETPNVDERAERMEALNRGAMIEAGQQSRLPRPPFGLRRSATEATAPRRRDKNRRERVIMSDSFYPVLEQEEKQISEARNAFDGAVQRVQNDQHLSDDGKAAKISQLRAGLESQAEQIRTKATKDAEFFLQANLDSIRKEREAETAQQRIALNRVPMAYADMMKTRVQNTPPEKLAALLEEAADDADKTLILGYAVAIHGTDNWEVATLLTPNPKLDKLRARADEYRHALKAIPEHLDPFRDEKIAQRFGLKMPENSSAGLPDYR